MSKSRAKYTQKIINLTREKKNGIKRDNRNFRMNIKRAQKRAIANIRNIAYKLYNIMHIGSTTSLSHSIHIHNMLIKCSKWVNTRFFFIVICMYAGWLADNAWLLVRRDFQWYRTKHHTHTHTTLNCVEIHSVYRWFLMRHIFVASWNTSCIKLD